METRVLRYYLAVVSEGNISSAAKLLHITQPTLSRQIKDLEEELGVQLFLRKGKYLELTKEGIYLAEQARDIVRLVDKTTTNINKSNEIYGEIMIGMAESQSIKKIGQAIKNIREEHSKIHFDLYSGNAEQIIEQLESGLLDFGVVIEPINKIEYSSLSLDSFDEWGILTRQDSEFKNVDKITSDMIPGKQFMISSQNGVKTMLASLLNIKEADLNVVVKYNLLYNASLLVEAGVGHAICIDGLINTDENNLTFIPFDPPIKSSLSIIWKKDKPLSEASQYFLEHLKKELG
nr:LysR family transcriptional regulator [Mammaliicoccus sp. Marseille-Q6498]